jgi:hypothetical protein
VFDHGVVRSLTVEVTFVGSGSARTAEPAAEGVVRLPDDTLKPFCGWIDLLAVLERATTKRERNSHVDHPRHHNPHDDHDDHDDDEVPLPR